MSIPFSFPVTSIISLKESHKTKERNNRRTNIQRINYALLSFCCFMYHFKSNISTATTKKLSWSEQVFKLQSLKENNLSFWLTSLALPEVLLGFMHVQHAFHSLLCVVLVVDKFALSQDEPAASPVAPRECRGASTFLQQPALFERLLPAPEPQECFILQHTPATLPGVQQATCNIHVMMTKIIGMSRLSVNEMQR